MCQIERKYDPVLLNHSEAAAAGFSAIAARYNVRLADLNDQDDIVYCSGFPLARIYFDYDAVINLTKAKTHRRFGVSLSSKSLIGILVGKRTCYPKLLNRHNHVPLLVNSIVGNSPPCLSFIDGTAGLEGNGPLDGVPTKSRFLVISRDFFAADVLACVEMGFNPALVPALIQPIRDLKENTILDTQINRRCLRKGTYDFLPPMSCPWMYKSLYYKDKRIEKRYQPPIKGAMECWPT
jgi:uncharacterized protein (DUF362 family)